MFNTNQFLLNDKIIIVTGGCGLLGSEFCKSIAKITCLGLKMDHLLSIGIRSQRL